MISAWSDQGKRSTGLQRAAAYLNRPPASQPSLAPEQPGSVGLDGLCGIGVIQVAGHSVSSLGNLGKIELTPHDTLERDSPDLGIGHPPFAYLVMSASTPQSF